MAGTEKGVFKMKMNQKQLLALGISMMLGAGMLTGCAAAADSSLSKATGQGNAAAGSTSADASDAGTEADEGTSAADAGATKTDSAANIDAGVDSGHTTISAEASDYVMASPDQASVNFTRFPGWESGRMRFTRRTTVCIRRMTTTGTILSVTRSQARWQSRISRSTRWRS